MFSLKNTLSPYLSTSHVCHFQWIQAFQILENSIPTKSEMTLTPALPTTTTSTSTIAQFWLAKSIPQKSGREFKKLRNLNQPLINSSLSTLTHHKYHNKYICFKNKEINQH
jgi:hypothetical protein